MNDADVRDHGAQEGDLVMPFYIVCDTSGSMSGDMANVHEALLELQQEVKDTPLIADLTQIGVLTFNSSSQVAIPLGNLEYASITQFGAGGGTNYGESFRVLRKTMDEDYQRLKSQGYSVFRPCAFFLTDGGPTDREWERDFATEFHYDDASKAGNRYYPRFIPFGFRDARLDTLSKIAYPPKGGRAFVASNGTTAGQALRSIKEFLAQTIISTGLTNGSGAPRHVVAETTEGFNSTESQYAGGDVF
ncbi:Uncharacterized conserved protein YegL, contains vWA domain of TerY type [Nocardioides alpinus]|uniref:Uncharacterized conserved protein YegL, contains vWA domain of TerY type n=1 Tax=Nocardioides alpinus TaxID=748909 RepID=A0A1I1B2N0_9ACTN|nr:VWA domain-containing protein [Nocardioides alpinus]PKH40155.1 VWA domain-containing protein [Nocardioides alpinus]SFB44619.1 Uncharacterized conserved protein YegL, contains vWA domain of TerY type [Nocardioides alpinus]